MIQLKSAADMREISSQMAVLKGNQFKKIVEGIDKAGEQGEFQSFISVEELNEKGVEIVECALTDAGYQHKFYKINGTKRHEVAVYWDQANEDCSHC